MIHKILRMTLITTGLGIQALLAGNPYTTRFTFKGSREHFEKGALLTRRTEKYPDSISQACGNYYYFVDNKKVEITTYDRKNNPSLVIIYSISNVNPNSEGYQSEVMSVAKDSEGNILSSGEGTFKCVNGDLLADMHITTPVTAGQFSGMETKVTPAYIVYPADMQIGATLPPTTFHAEIFQNGNHFASLDYTIEQRNVEAREEVTTPAGTWDCLRISYRMTVKMNMGISVSSHYTIVEWFAPGFGLVKTIHYNKKGKIAGSAQLTKLEN